MTGIPVVEEPSFAPTKIHMDSTAAISLAMKEQVSQRNKHISIKVHHIRELLAIGRIVLTYIRSKDNPADALTKTLIADQLHKLTSLMRLHSC